MALTLLGSSAAAARIGCHPYTLMRWHRNGTLIPAVVDSAGRRLYTTEQLDAFTKQRATTKERQ